MSGIIKATTLRDESDNDIAVNTVFNGTAKAYCRYDQLVPEIDVSFNISSVSDDAIGMASHNYTSVMVGNGQYTSHVSCASNTYGAASQGTIYHGSRTWTYGTATSADTTCNNTVFGDLA